MKNKRVILISLIGVILLFLFSPSFVLGACQPDTILCGSNCCPSTQECYPSGTCCTPKTCDDYTVQSNFDPSKLYDDTCGNKELYCGPHLFSTATNLVITITPQITCNDNYPLLYAPVKCAEPLVDTSKFVVEGVSSQLKDKCSETEFLCGPGLCCPTSDQSVIHNIEYINRNTCKTYEIGCGYKVYDSGATQILCCTYNFAAQTSESYTVGSIEPDVGILSVPEDTSETTFPVHPYNYLSNNDDDGVIELQAITSEKLAWGSCGTKGTSTSIITKDESELNLCIQKAPAVVGMKVMEDTVIRWTACPEGYTSSDYTSSLGAEKFYVCKKEKLLELGDTIVAYARFVVAPAGSNVEASACADGEVRRGYVTVNTVRYDHCVTKIEFTDEYDNCPSVKNENQEDTNQDGIGDACEEQNCTDGLDDEKDNNNLIDCNDPGCVGKEGPNKGICCKHSSDCVAESGGIELVDVTCSETDFECKEKKCDDNKDNDGDNLIDCKDSSCHQKIGALFETQNCLLTGGCNCNFENELVCNDGFDNDGDDVREVPTGSTTGLPRVQGSSTASPSLPTPERPTASGGSSSGGTNSVVSEQANLNGVQNPREITIPQFSTILPSTEYDLPPDSSSPPPPPPSPTSVVGKATASPDQETGTSWLARFMAKISSLFSRKGAIAGQAITNPVAETVGIDCSDSDCVNAARTGPEGGKCCFNFNQCDKLGGEYCGENNECLLCNEENKFKLSKNKLSLCNGIRWLTCSDFSRNPIIEPDVEVSCLSSTTKLFIVKELNCNNNLDDDNDGVIDRRDTDCGASLGYTLNKENWYEIVIKSRNQLKVNIDANVEEEAQAGSSAPAGIVNDISTTSGTVTPGSGAAAPITSEGSQTNVNNMQTR